MMRESLFNWVDFKLLGDSRGSLVALEQNKSIPFEIQRVYYIYGTAAGVSRGFHAHHSLRQLAICVHGSCRMVLDTGSRREEELMDSPQRGVLIDNLVWHEMHEFSPDCVLLVLANDYYDESDYVRNYEDFLRVVASSPKD